MKNIFNPGTIILLFAVSISLNGISQDCGCSRMNCINGIAYENKWEYHKDGSAHVTGIIPYNGECCIFRKNHMKIIWNYKEGIIVSIDSLEVAYLSWGNYNSGDSISLNDLKSFRKFMIVSPASERSWKIKKYDLYFTKVFPTVHTDSGSTITHESCNYFHGKSLVINKEMSDYLKNSKYDDFNVFRICPRKVMNNKGKKEGIDDFVLYIKQD